MNKKSDKEIILEYLLTHGELSALTAWKEFNILTSLRSRISDLRKAGHKITTEMVSCNGKTFAKYSLVRQPKQLQIF